MSSFPACLPQVAIVPCSHSTTNVHPNFTLELPDHVKMSIHSKVTNSSQWFKFSLTKFLKLECSESGILQKTH